MTEEVVLSGLRPTGTLHIGHIVGAINNWKKLQEKYDCYYTIVDWHALTSHYKDTGDIESCIYELAAEWLAVGLDPEKCTIFLQSDVKEHAELHLLFSMITPLPWLERIPTYKEQREKMKDKDLSTYGFLGYPLLQTADIAIYKGNRVPVGEDQVSHIEVARKIVRRFNKYYDEVFPEPEPMLTQTPRLPGTDGRKMSKSYGNDISLSDTEEEIRSKVANMKTDPARKTLDDPGDPEICPVFDFHEVFSGEEDREKCATGCRNATIGCVECKEIMCNNLLDYMKPMMEKRTEYLENMDYVRDVLKEGAEKARSVARSTMEEVREAMNI